MRACRLSSAPRAVVLALACFLILVLGGSAASAATRTVCFRVNFADGRSNCPTSGTGARRSCAAAGSFTWAVGHRIELWDKDPAGGDEFIGMWRIAAGGNTCATFEWENASYALGEPHPDVYLRYINEVETTSGTSPIVRATDTNGNGLAITTWRDGVTGDPDRFVVNDCTTAGSCQIFPSGNMSPTADLSTTLAQSIAGLDSAQHGLQTFGSVMTTALVQLRHPSTDPNCPSTGGAMDRNTMCFPSGLATDGHLVAHELGHVIQMREFTQDTLVNDVSNGGGGWNLNTNGFEFQSGATTEGFATYAAVVSWWDPQNTGTAPVGWGINFETATLSDPDCADNAWLPRQVAKAYWDIDDLNNEAGVGAASSWPDSAAVTTTSITNGWSVFANGTADRQNDEANANGVNLWDYDFSNNQDNTSFMNHNCMQSQVGPT